MTGTEWGVLGGAFLGGAFPWLEAIVVIPAGILGGAPPVLVVIFALVGNLITVGIAAYFGEQIREKWRLRREAKHLAVHHPELTKAELRDKGREILAAKDAQPTRIKRIMTKWGLPGLAILGPVGLGTQLSAVTAVAMGVRARSAFVWVGIGTALWAITAGVVTVYGISFFDGQSVSVELTF